MRSYPLMRYNNIESQVRPPIYPYLLSDLKVILYQISKAISLKFELLTIISNIHSSSGPFISRDLDKQPVSSPLLHNLCKIRDYFIPCVTAEPAPEALTGVGAPEPLTEEVGATV